MTHPLPILFIPVLPFSSPLCCHYWHTTDRGGPYVADEKEVSPYNVALYLQMPESFGICEKPTFCNKVTLEDDKHGNVTMWACDGGVCSEVGCSTRIRNDGTAVQVCCCTDNFCNPASGPTVLLSLAPLIALIAARA
ncbi:hypothetical protein PRIPAC_90089 [Pristionchus pacificus]|uniref:Uncharacterized protein n=1 Tax=Pristionchus pacificus TaxID=54126 RepID=A0A2A6B8C4_PRIPA|nr:hypothetical protein PRIPAC_90089 [Pristionchus pacificus]|eukprot:PDM62126.1 hypothetical protein PRIPAC_51568 [Pristionchus pacificus]